MAPIRASNLQSLTLKSTKPLYTTLLLTPSQSQQTRSVATTRRFTKANRNSPSATATPSSKYLRSTAPTSTIIFHPPPSAPSPYQTPPLFLPDSDPRKTLLAQSHAFNNPYASGSRPLPPPVRELAPTDKKYHLSQQDIAEIRRLRAEDPWTWTVPKLAEKFGCSKIFIGIAAPASEQRKEWGLALHQRFRDRWGRRKLVAVQARHKRRELWEKDL